MGEPSKDIDPPWGTWGRSLTLGCIASVGRVVMRVLNTTTIENAEAIDKWVHGRPPGQGLITVSNHRATIDDPFLFAAFLPLRFFFTESWHHGNRWTLCARNICYKNAFLEAFFRTGKTLPVERGGGVEQPIMAVVERRIAAGDWLHVFPEGRILQAAAMGPFRWGIGKLVCDTASAPMPPVVLPFHHRGTDAILPVKTYVPHAGKHARIVFGKPVPLADLQARCRACRDDAERRRLWGEITTRVEASLVALEKENPPEGAAGAPAPA